MKAGKIQLYLRLSFPWGGERNTLRPMHAVSLMRRLFWCLAFTLLATVQIFWAASVQAQTTNCGNQQFNRSFRVHPPGAELFRNPVLEPSSYRGTAGTNGTCDFSFSSNVIFLGKPLRRAAGFHFIARIIFGTGNYSMTCVGSASGSGCSADRFYCASGHFCNWESNLPGGITLRFSSVGYLVTQVRAFGGPFTAAPALPLQFSMSHSAASVQAGGTATATYTITNPNTNSIYRATNGRFDHDFAVFAPGVTVPTLPASGFCGTGSTVARSSTFGTPERFLEFRNISLSAGASCSFSVSYAVPGNFQSNTIRQLTGPLTADILGSSVQSAAASSNITVTNILTAQAATLSMQLDPASALAGAARSIRYTISLPAGVAPPDRIEFEHDVGFFRPGITVGAPVPANPCGAGSSFVSLGTSAFYGLRGGQLAPGASCTFSVPILTAGIAPGSYEQRTGPLRTIVGLTTLTSPAASVMMTVAAPDTTPPVINVSNVTQALDAGAATRVSNIECLCDRQFR